MKSLSSFKIFIFLGLTLALESCGNHKSAGFSDSENSEKATHTPDTVYINDTVRIIEPPDVSGSSISITSTNAEIFYFQCSNTIEVDLPEGWTNLSLTGSNAEVIQVKDSPFTYAVIPSGKTCLLNCSATTRDGSTLQWQKEYNVIHPPRPSIELTVNGNPYDNLSPILKSSRLQLKLVNTEFVSQFPEDSGYRIGSINILAQLILGPPTIVNTINSSGMDANKGIPFTLGARVRQMKPGTAIFLEIKDLHRLNAKNQMIKENFNFGELVSVFILR